MGYKTEQIDNRNVISSTKELYIYIQKTSYFIHKRNYFSEYLSRKKYTLQDAINLRDSLLSILF